MIGIQIDGDKGKTIKIGKYTLPLRASLEGFEAEVHDLSLEPIEFHFEYLRFKFKCTCFDINPGSPPIFTLTSDLGAVPFTAQSPYARYAVLTIVKSALAHLNGTVRMVDGRIAFAAFHPIESPVTSTSLVSAIANALVKVKPYLELLAEINGGIRR